MKLYFSRPHIWVLETEKQLSGLTQTPSTEQEKATQRAGSTRSVLGSARAHSWPHSKRMRGWVRPKRRCTPGPGRTCDGAAEGLPRALGRLDRAPRRLPGRLRTLALTPHGTCYGSPAPWAEAPSSWGSPERAGSKPSGHTHVQRQDGRPLALRSSLSHYVVDLLVLGTHNASRWSKAVP